jgi:hypothetical protein
MSAMPSSAANLLVATALLTGGAASLLPAQSAGAPASAPCDGKRVTRVDIRPDRPLFQGTASRWRHAARAIGLHHATTRPGVVAAFVALEPGAICTERRRAESERLLRAQPFIADAAVRAMPDGLDGVAILVETRDEMPVLVNAAFRGVAPRAFSLGSTNVAGEGLLLEASFARGYQYRSEVGGRIVSFATFGKPYVATIEGARYTVGQRLNVGLAKPFFTDLQKVGWHVGYLTADDYPRVRRPADDELALGVRQQRWDASAFARVFGVRTVGIVGLAASGVRLTPERTGIVIADTGLAPDTGSTLRNRYSAFRSTRVGGLAGARRLTYRTVRGFNGLTSNEDVASGWAGGLYVAKGLPNMGENDLFLSGVAYAGLAGERALLGSSWEMEGRRGQGLGYWDSVVGSSRTAFYLGGGPGFLFLAEDQLTGATRSLLPVQLALGDREGGMLGYHASSLAGAKRNIARAELRWSGEAIVRNADVGFATFTQVGSVWAGDAPYGSTATRATVGVSILAAYPTGSKRVYRADFGFPLTRRGEGGGKFEIFFSSQDRTQWFWREPSDVSYARTGPVPSSLFAFPTR